MRKRVVFVQNSSGEIVWRYVYEDFEEMLKDLRMLEKPSMFGTRFFRIVIQLDE